jgi:hypothetical protein
MREGMEMGDAGIENRKETVAPGLDITIHKCTLKHPTPPKATSPRKLVKFFVGLAAVSADPFMAPALLLAAIYQGVHSRETSAPYVRSRTPTRTGGMETPTQHVRAIDATATNACIASRRIMEHVGIGAYMALWIEGCL